MNTQKKIGFYRALAKLIMAKEFSCEEATSLVGLYERVRGEISFGHFFSQRFTSEFLIAAYKDLHGMEDDLKTVELLAELAFKDLAKHMRSPEVRNIFTNFINMFTDEDSDLFVHVASVRRLGRNSKGPAVVTLVVNSYSVLKDLLDGCDPTVHPV